MATVLIVTSAPPLVEGGHMVIARALERACREAGHHAGIVTTPSNRFGRQASAYAANWLTDVGRTGTGAPVDCVISLRYPSYAVRHPHHVCWLTHTMREYYDRWDEFAAGLSPQGRLKERARRAVVHAADSYLLRHNVTALFAISATVQARVVRWNGLTPRVLHPPPPPRPYRCDQYGDYLFFTSRLSPLKRADLAIAALAEPAAHGIRLVVAGEGEDAPRLARLADERGVAARVTFAGHVNEAVLVDHLARCRAVVFVPKDEDYGFVTAEAFASGKAVITAADSGGPLELVREGETGYVVPATPAALATAYRRVMDDSAAAERLGQAGQRAIATLTWAATIDQLLRS